MKKIAIINIASLVGVVVFFATMITLTVISDNVSAPSNHPASVKASELPGPRFKAVHGQHCVDLKKFTNYTAKDNEHCIEGDTHLWDIEVLRDNDSGVEFICAFYDHTPSCFTTGRRLEK